MKNTNTSRAFDYLILGGGISGTTAAETIRQKDPVGSIALVEEEPYFLYSRVLLPKFIRSDIGLDKVMLRTASDYKKNGIEIFLGECTKIFDPEQMILKTVSGRKFNAAKVLIASGGRPKQWKFSDFAPENIFQLQTLDDALRIKDFLTSRPAGEAVVAGGGFIALEFIEILKHYGWKITLLCKDKSFWPDYLDERGSEILSGIWKKNGIEVIFEDEVSNVEHERSGNDMSVNLITKNGRELSAGFVGIGIGLDRNSDFLSNLVVQPLSTGIGVNEYLETTFPNVWAAGDVAFYPDPFSERKRLGGNWSGAFMQGKTAGNNLTGFGKEQYKSLSSYSIGHLGFGISFVGDTGPFEKKFGVSVRLLRYIKEKNEYARIFFKNGHVIGAALINGNKFIGKVSQAIINKWDVSKITLD